MKKHFLLIGVVSVGLLLTACSDKPEDTSKQTDNENPIVENG